MLVVVLGSATNSTIASNAIDVPPVPRGIPKLLEEFVIGAVAGIGAPIEARGVREAGPSQRVLERPIIRVTAAASGRVYAEANVDNHFIAGIASQTCT